MARPIGVNPDDPCDAIFSVKLPQHELDTINRSVKDFDIESRSRFVRIACLREAHRLAYERHRRPGVPSRNTITATTSQKGSDDGPEN